MEHGTFTLLIRKKRPPGSDASRRHRGKPPREKVYNGTEDWEIIVQLGYVEFWVLMGYQELPSR